MDSAVFLLFIGITVVGLIVVAIMSRFVRKKIGLDPAYYAKEWQKIEKLSGMGETGWHVAIMHADKLLDQALKTRDFHGETAGERLASATKSHLFRYSDRVWNAHKLRNRLAHETEVRLNQVQVRRSLNAYKAGLKDAGAL